MKVKPAPKSGGAAAIVETRQSAVNLKKILVPVDFSHCSHKALQYAIPFAKQFGASLVLLHVIEPYVPIPETTTVDWGLVDRQLRENGQQQLNRLLRSLVKDVKAGTELRFGRAEFEIVQAAKELDIDLIILSTHGHTGLAHVFMGSTTERVVRHASCPVLVVREREREFVGTPAAGNSADAVRATTKRGTRS